MVPLFPQWMAEIQGLGSSREAWPGLLKYKKQWKPSWRPVKSYTQRHDFTWTNYTRTCFWRSQWQHWQRKKGNKKIRRKSQKRIKLHDYHYIWQKLEIRYGIGWTAPGGLCWPLSPTSATLLEMVQRALLTVSPGDLNQSGCTNDLSVCNPFKNTLFHWQCREDTVWFRSESPGKYMGFCSKTCNANKNYAKVVKQGQETI